jgi:hypothetical protein
VTDLPILFSGAMVRAWLDGRKGMTRRLLYAERKAKLGTIPASATFDPRYKPPLAGPLADIYYTLSGWHQVQPGDRLWVRESFATPFAPSQNNTGAIFRADGPEYLSTAAAAHQWGADAPWRVSIHMPRRLSRLTLVVTATKIERVQDISEADAMAEGIATRDHSVKWPNGDPGEIDNVRARSFARLWESLHGPGAWDKNPWVVALTCTAHRCNIDKMEGV